MFNAFERHQYYNLKDLISITKQPVVRIAYEIQDVQHLGWWGGGALLSTPYNGLYGEAPPKWGIFFRRQVYEGVGISLAEVTEGVGKSVILIGEKAQKGYITHAFLLRTLTVVVIHSYLIAVHS